MKKQLLFQKLIEQENSTKQKLFYSAVYLFSIKGYANVGIRELCTSVNIKSSSFYNHYKSKDQLFETILNYFDETRKKVILTDQEIKVIVKKGSIENFFRENMKKFALATSSPVFLTALKIIKMEYFTNEHAFELEKTNLHDLRKGYTKKVLQQLMDKGCIKECDIDLITAEYYYGLKGLLDEYLLYEVWDEDLSDIMKKIDNHIMFFVHLLQVES